MCLDNQINNFYSVDDNYNKETFESEFCDNCQAELNEADSKKRTCNQCAFEGLEENNLFSIKDSAFQITALPSNKMIQAANRICKDIFDGDPFYVSIKHIEGEFFAICIHHVEAVPPLEITENEDGISVKIAGLAIKSQNMAHAMSVVFSLHNKKQQQNIKVAA